MGVAFCERADGVASQTGLFAIRVLSLFGQRGRRVIVVMKPGGVDKGSSVRTDVRAVQRAAGSRQELP